MDRNQIKKLGKKFNVKPSKKVKPDLEDSGFNFNNSHVDVVNLTVVNTLLNQLKQKTFVTKYDIYNFDIQMDEFLSIFPEKYRLGLAGEILKIFQVKSTREIKYLKQSEVLSTIIDNKIKFFEALYIMQVNAQFKNYLLPQTILFRFSKALCEIAGKVGFIREEAIPSEYNNTQYINFMYVIMNKIIVAVGETSGGVQKVVQIEESKPLNQIVVPKPIVPKPAETVHQGSPMVAKPIVDKHIVDKPTVDKAPVKQPFMIKLKPDYTINQTRLNNLLTEFITIENEPRSVAQLNITNGIRIMWNQTIPELLDFNKDKYSIKLDVPNPNKVYAGLNFAFSDIRNLFNGNGNFAKVCSEFAPGTTINDTKIIGYKYKDTEITYERYSTEILDCATFRSDYSIITECKICGEHNTYKLQSFINRIQANSIGCRNCVRTLNHKGIENIGEILNAMDKVNIPMNKINIKNFTNFKIKNSILLECQCQCGKLVKGDDLLKLLTRDTNRVNCSEGCSPFSDDTYRLIFAVNSYDIWQGAEYRSLAKKLVDNSLYNMRIAMEKYGTKEVKDVPSVKQVAEGLVKESERLEKGNPMAQDENTVKEVRPVRPGVVIHIDPIEAIINGLEASSDITIVGREEKMEKVENMEKVEDEAQFKQLKIDSISDGLLREEFFKKFIVPKFGFKIFAYIPELKLYSGMLMGDGNFNPLVCSWSEDGKLEDKNLNNIENYSFKKRNVIIITDNNLNTVLEAMLKHQSNKIMIPNGGLEEADVLEIKTKFAELVIAKLNNK